MFTKFLEPFRRPSSRNSAGKDTGPDELHDSSIDAASFGLQILYPKDESDTTTLTQQIDIVAVHGLGGHAMDTWTHPVSRKLWLRDFLPHTIPNARVMTFGYDSRVVGSKSVIGMMENANTLLTQLSLSRNSHKDRPLIFVGHSLGGLVIKKALIMAREANVHKKILENTRAIMFMGVPHDGADAAKLAGRISAVAQVFCNLNRINLKDLERDSRPLQEISLSFGYLEGFDIITVMESEKTAIPGTTTSILVVPATSAKLNLGNRERWFHITGADHSGVCKFATEADAGYMMVRGHLEEVANQACM